MTSINLGEFIKKIKKCRQTKESFAFNQVIHELESEIKKQSSLPNDLDIIDDFLKGVLEFSSVIKHVLTSNDEEYQSIYRSLPLNTTYSYVFNASGAPLERKELYEKFVTQLTEDDPFVSNYVAAYGNGISDYINMLLLIIRCNSSIKRGAKIINNIESTKAVEFFDDEEDDDYI